MLVLRILLYPGLFIPHAGHCDSPDAGTRTLQFDRKRSAAAKQPFNSLQRHSSAADQRGASLMMDYEQQAAAASATAATGAGPRGRSRTMGDGMGKRLFGRSLALLI